MCCVTVVCHVHIEAPILTKRCPNFLRTSLIYVPKQSTLLFSYLAATITCFAFSQKKNSFGKIRENTSLPCELQHRYATFLSLKETFTVIVQKPSSIIIVNSKKVHRLFQFLFPRIYSLIILMRYE